LAALVASWPVLLTHPPFLAAALLAGTAALAGVVAALMLVATLLLAALQRGAVRSVAQLHGEHVTASRPLMLVQSAVAALQVAALLIVGYGSVLVLRDSTLFRRSMGAPGAGITVARLAWPAGASVNERSLWYRGMLERLP